MQHILSKLHFKEYGSGEPLLVLHGLFGTGDNWQTLARRWASEFTVFCLDLRNHGRSPFTETHTYKDLADDLAEFMDAHWIHRAHIIGHSMGGKAVMQFALDYEDKIDKLVVADIAPKRYTGGHEKVFEALHAVDLTQIESRENVAQILAKYLENDNATLQFLLKNLTRNPETMELIWKMNLPVLEKYYQEMLGNIDLNSNSNIAVQTLFLRGENSNYVKNEDFDQIKSLFTNAELQTIANAGHWLHAENPNDFYEATMRFFVR